MRHFIPNSRKLLQFHDHLLLQKRINYRGHGVLREYMEMTDEDPAESAITKSR
jgi:hypothetical protein